MQLLIMCIDIKHIRKLTTLDEYFFKKNAKFQHFVTTKSMILKIERGLPLCYPSIPLNSMKIFSCNIKLLRAIESAIILSVLQQFKSYKAEESENQKGSSSA